MEIVAGSRLETADPEVYASIAGEERRQQENLELIASESYASRAVREAMSRVMTNKYAEGYPLILSLRNLARRALPGGRTPVNEE